MTTYKYLRIPIPKPILRPWKEIPWIDPLQSSSHSVHMNVGSDMCFGVVGICPRGLERNITGHRDGEASSIITPTIHRTSFYGLSIVI
jgi:hypothetical protein